MTDKIKIGKIKESKFRQQYNELKKFYDDKVKENEELREEIEDLKFIINDFENTVIKIKMLSSDPEVLRLAEETLVND